MENNNKIIKNENQNDIQERNERYNKYVEAIVPKTSPAKSLFHAFWIGGLTCCIAQALQYIYKTIFPSLSLDMVGNITLMTVIVLAIFLTGLGIYDRMARYGGAGTFLPITGFANAMASASMEFKTEGLILGTSTKLFTIVGPVVVNGIVWSTVAGIVHWLISLY